MNLSYADSAYYGKSLINDAYLGGIRVYAYDDDIVKYIKRVTGAGGVITAEARINLVDLVRPLKEKGIWPKISEFAIFAGLDYTSSKFKIKSSTSNYSLDHYNFSPASYVSSGSNAGLKGNGTSTYIDSNYNSSTANPTSMGVFCYFNGSEAVGTTRYMIGSQQRAARPNLNVTGLAWFRSGTVDAGAIGAAVIEEFAPAVGAASAYSSGSVFVGTNGSSNQQYYRNGSAVSGPVAATQTPANRNMYIFANNFAGNPSQFSTRRILSYGITSGMNEDEVKILSDSVNEYLRSYNANIY
jgi:hypothetical protein